jgi:glycosyltransferase involved in cell wall biosynthesis
MRSPPRILVDLSVASEAYAGIPHEARLIFAMLAKQDDLRVSGLIYPLGQAVPFRMDPEHREYAGHLAAALHITSHGYSRPNIRHPLLRITSFLREVLREAKGAIRSARQLYPIPEQQKSEALWRILFHKTLSPADRAHVLARDFFFANLSANQVHGRANYLPKLRPHKLMVEGHDIVLLPYLRPFRVPRSVKKVIRYHDAIALRHPDTIAHWRMGIWEQRFTRLCAKDSIFACNSPTSRDDLDFAVPGAGERAIIIPPPLPDAPALHSAPTVHDIVRRRRSMLSLSLDPIPSPHVSETRRMLDARLPVADRLRYIISVSTIEPRKNFAGLIAAWERLRAATREDVKLLLVANRGWAMEQTLDAMRPHVVGGDLIHLQNVTTTELQVLYEKAELCSFIPFAEGFGNCPLEALRAGTPVVASDIPVFRWSLGEAACFADPYNPGQIAQVMQSLLRKPDNEDRRSQMLRRAPALLERFSVSTVSDQWRALMLGGLAEMEERLRKRALRSFYSVRLPATLPAGEPT